MTEHYIYIITSAIWRDTDTNQRIIKIGSTNNIYARLKNFKTANPYPIDIIGYYAIHNYNCYKLDNIIKIQLNHHRVNYGGGTEFYFEFDKIILEKLFTNCNIDYEWKNVINKEQINNITKEEIISDSLEQITFQEKSKTYITDLTKCNIMLFTIGKNNVVYNNYLKTIQNGIVEKDKTQYIWGIQNEKSWNNMKVGDYLFFIVSHIEKDQCVDVLRVTEKKLSNQISINMWNDGNYKYIFFLEKICKKTISKTEFIKQLGYREKWTIQGCPIMDKKKQHTNINYLLDYLII